MDCYLIPLRFFIFYCHTKHPYVSDIQNYLPNNNTIPSHNQYSSIFHFQTILSNKYTFQKTRDQTIYQTIILFHLIINTLLFFTFKLYYLTNTLFKKWRPNYLYSFYTATKKSLTKRDIWLTKIKECSWNIPATFQEHSLDPPFLPFSKSEKKDLGQVSSPFFNLIILCYITISNYYYYYLIRFVSFLL